MTPAQMLTRIADLEKRLAELLLKKNKVDTERRSLLVSIRSSFQTQLKFIEHERKRLGPAGLDGHLNAIGGIAKEAVGYIDDALAKVGPRAGGD